MITEKIEVDPRNGITAGRKHGLALEVAGLARQLKKAGDIEGAREKWIYAATLEEASSMYEGQTQFKASRIVNAARLYLQGEDPINASRVSKSGTETIDPNEYPANYAEAVNIFREATEILATQS